MKKLALLILLFVAVPLSVCAQEEDNIWDPFEPVNRKVFTLNDTVDVYVLEPVAKGYEAALPQPVRKGVNNFFENLGYPRYLVSDLVQFKFTDAAKHTGRFLVNTTVGFLGVVDVAQHFGLERKRTDFGVALAYHGVPPGPYLVLPLLGPSNLRDTLGSVVDGFLDPLNAITYTNAASSTKLAVSVGGRIVQVIDTRAGLLDAVKAAKESSLDYYLFLQSSYYQYRQGLLKGTATPDDNPINVTSDNADEY